MKTRTRPATKPQGPTEPTGPGWMSYGGHRAHNRAMENWGDELRHWHKDAQTRGILCYADCGHCKDALRSRNHTGATTAHAAWSLAQTEAGRAWMATEEARQAAR